MQTELSPSEERPSEVVLEALRRVFGFAGLRPGQWEVVAAVLAGTDALAVMPTGAGKSLCFQLPAIVSHHLTVVVSPLIALMRDQVAQLKARGVEAGALHSGNSSADRFDVETAIRQRRLKLLYVSPERLVRPDTLDLIKMACCDRLAIDEAHCVSQWGHDFRPEYMGLRDAAHALGDPPILAVTASADAQTRDEIVAKLFSRKPQRFVASFDRPNLHLAVERKANVMRRVQAFVHAHKGESGIIYAASRKSVDALAEALKRQGVWALPYHAGMEGHHRNAHQDEFLQRSGVVIIATIAFGMGIDKSDVRYVCHVDLPGSIEGYYQEIGRAGRDGERADTLLLWGEGDIRLRERQIAFSDATPARKASERRRLTALLALCESQRCRRQTLLDAFGEASAPCGFCDICDGRHPMFDGVMVAQKAMSAMLRTSGRFYPAHLANLLVGKATEAIRRHAHDQLTTFGIGTEFGAPEWRSVFRQIQAAGLITQDAGGDGRWRVTDAGRAVLTGGAALQLITIGTPARGARTRRILSVIAEDNADTKSRFGVDRIPAQETMTVAEQRLFAALKAKRLALAKALKLPPYVIFNDKTLREIARARPHDSLTLGQIHGLGPKKIESYGEMVIALVKQHEAE